MPASLSLRIKERYMARRAEGLSQQVAADAVGISVRSAQRIDRGDLQPEGQQQQRARHWRTRADPLAEVWDSVLVPMLEKVRSVLQRLEGSEALVAGLLYGSGLRLMEALRLRVHDLDFNW